VVSLSHWILFISSLLNICSTDLDSLKRGGDGEREKRMNLPFNIKGGSLEQKKRLLAFTLYFCTLNTAVTCVHDI
jgi:hypothetical protein